LALAPVCNVLIQYESAFEENKRDIAQHSDSYRLSFCQDMRGRCQQLQGCRIMDCDSNSGFRGKSEAANSMCPARSSSSNRSPPCSESCTSILG
jgi:hypothetical protein